MNNEEVRKYVPDAEFSGEYWITSVPSSVLRIDYKITGFETKVIQDCFGHDLIILWEIQTKRCKFQDNIKNFLKMYGRNGEGNERQKKIFVDNTYRTVLSNIYRERLEKKEESVS